MSSGDIGERKDGTVMNMMYVMYMMIDNVDVNVLQWRLKISTIFSSQFSP